MIVTLSNYDNKDSYLITGSDEDARENFPLLLMILNIFTDKIILLLHKISYCFSETQLGRGEVVCIPRLGLQQNL